MRVIDGAGRELDVGPAKRQVVLAALLMDAGRLVTVGALVDRGWGDAPPPQVAGVLRAHLSRIRTQLAVVRDGGAQPALVRRAGGYVLDVDPGRVDVHRFRSLAAAADSAADDGQRAALFSQARDVWTGDPLAGLSGRWVTETAESLHRDYADLTVGWAGAQLRLGRVGAVVGALGELVGRDRFDEVLAAAFLTALAASGRRAQALAEYGRIREHLVTELGSEPGPELRAVYGSLLELEPAAATGVSGPVRVSSPAPVAELPPAVHPFCGRDAELADLDDARTGPARAVVLTGAGGVGKTALAVQWAWRRRESFRDGQLYVDLRGLDADPVPADRVLGRFLRALGVPAADIPSDGDERAALYRSLSAERRLLVVLDNAGSSAQVRPLLPGSPTCLAVVTSRRRLDGLVAHEGAARLAVDVLDPTASVQLLTTILAGRRPVGPDRSLDVLAELCGGFPLALRMAAARLLADPGRSVPSLVSELAGRHRLSGLDVEDGDMGVRRAFDLSYRRLPAPAARAFRLLSHVPATGDGLGVAATAALLGLEEPATRETIDPLADVHLVTVRPDGRYDMHDLIRLHAQEQTADEPGSVDDGLRRLLGWYVRSCDAADHVLSRGRPVLARPATARGAPGAFPDEAAALAWFQAENATIPALHRLAAERGWDDVAWMLAESQAEVLQREHRLDDLQAVSTVGAAAASRAGNLSAEALLTNVSGIACVLAGRFEDGVSHLQRAAELHLRDGNPGRAGLTRMNVGSARSNQGHYDQAMSDFMAALDLLEEAGHASGVAICSCNLGELHRRLGDHAEAELYLRRAADLGREVGSGRDLAITLENLAEVLAATNRHGEALDGFDEALAVARAAGDRLTEGRALAGRGDLLATIGHADRAVGEWRAAMRIMEDIGAPEAASVRDRLISSSPVSGAVTG